MTLCLFRPGLLPLHMCNVACNSNVFQRPSTNQPLKLWIIAQSLIAFKCYFVTALIILVEDLVILQHRSPVSSHIRRVNTAAFEGLHNDKRNSLTKRQQGALKYKKITCRDKRTECCQSADEETEDVIYV